MLQVQVMGSSMGLLATREQAAQGPLWINSGQDDKQELSGGTLEGLSFSLTLMLRSQGSNGLFSPPVEPWMCARARVGAVVGKRVHIGVLDLS